MELYRGTNIPRILDTVVVAIGNFDGFHLGHRCVLDVLLRQANLKRSKSLVLSFYPLTKKVDLLMDFREKWDYLSGAGVDYLWMVPFFKIRKLDYQQFLGFLNRFLLIEEYVLGEDFRFGYQRKGSVKNLDKKVVLVSDCRVSSEKVSSSLVRRTKNLSRINRYLGRNYSVICRVINQVEYCSFLIVNAVNKFLLFEGFFLVNVIVEQKKVLGMAKVIFCQKKFNIELYLFDFNGNLLDKFLKIIFLREIIV